MSTWNADGLSPTRATLTLPYRQAAADGVVPLDGGVFEVASSYREPVLVAKLARPLAVERLIVRAEVGGAQLPEVVFGAYSDAGSQLPLFAPATTDGVAGPFSAQITVFH